MAVNDGSGDCTYGASLDRIAIIVYIDNDFRSLSHGIDSVNNHNNVGVLLLVLVFVNMTTAFDILISNFL